MGLLCFFSAASKPLGLTSQQFWLSGATLLAERCSTASQSHRPLPQMSVATVRRSCDVAAAAVVFCVFFPFSSNLAGVEVRVGVGVVAEPPRPPRLTDGGGDN